MSKIPLGSLESIKSSAARRTQLDMDGSIDRDRRNPSPWQALMMDPSGTIEPEARLAIIDNQQSISHAVLLPLLRVPSRLSTWIFTGLRTFVPNSWNGSGLLHWLIAVSAKFLLRPQAVRLLHRHFHIGDQVIEFLTINLGLENAVDQLGSSENDAFLDHLFVRHDLNLYNTIIDIAEAVERGEIDLKARPLENLDFSMINSEFDESFELPKKAWYRFWDLETAIEVFTPMFAILLPKPDFLRASHSLQFDEIVAALLGQLTGVTYASALVTNKHPFLPESTYRTGRRLMVHGIDSEKLFGMLLQLKAMQKKV